MAIDELIIQIVVNLKVCTWCSLIKYQNVIYFYDNFGRNYKRLSKYWINKNWCNSHDDWQSFNERSCGQHCLAFNFLIFKI